jgi:ESS family glutamate:Na+ symporter
MNLTTINGLLTLRLDMIQTVTAAALLLFLGYFIKRQWKLLDRLNIPAPVIGGLLFALLALGFRQTGVFAVQFDSALQTPFMIAFFTTVGLTASLKLLKTGGPQVLLFWILASILALFQNGLGVLLTKILGVHPFLGLVCGSVTMTGGHATGLAFGPIMESGGLPGATTLAVAAATFGLVSGGLIGGPVATRLIQRKRLKSSGAKMKPRSGAPVESMDDMVEDPKDKTSLSAHELMKYLTIILVCMAIGFTLPAYIGAMLVAALFRNICDFGKILKISQDYVELLGAVALSLFLTMAMSGLKLWELLDLALPMLLILAVQVVFIALFTTWITFRFMGRDYDAAVMAGGHCGFGLGATPNAVANMNSLVEKFGPAPRAFLVVPLVGAFFIDFTNALIITFFINIL